MQKHGLYVHVVVFAVQYQGANHIDYESCHSNDNACVCCRHCLLTEQPFYRLHNHHESSREQRQSACECSEI